MTGFDATPSRLVLTDIKEVFGVRAPKRLAFVLGDDRGRPSQARWRCDDAPSRPGSKAPLPMGPCGATKQTFRPAPVSATFTQHRACHDFVTGDSGDHRMSNSRACISLSGMCAARSWMTRRWQWPWNCYLERNSLRAPRGL